METLVIVVVLACVLAAIGVVWFLLEANLGGLSGVASAIRGDRSAGFVVPPVLANGPPPAPPAVGVGALATGPLAPPPVVPPPAPPPVFPPPVFPSLTSRAPAAPPIPAAVAPVAPAPAYPASAVRRLPRGAAHRARPRRAAVWPTAPAGPEPLAPDPPAPPSLDPLGALGAVTPASPAQPNRATPSPAEDPPLTVQESVRIILRTPARDAPPPSPAHAPTRPPEPGQAPPRPGEGRDLGVASAARRTAMSVGSRAREAILGYPFPAPESGDLGPPPGGGQEPAPGETVVLMGDDVEAWVRERLYGAKIPDR